MQTKHQNIIFYILSTISRLLTFEPYLYVPEKPISRPIISQNISAVIKIFFSLSCSKLKECMQNNFQIFLGENSIFSAFKCLRCFLTIPVDPRYDEKIYVSLVNLPSWIFFIIFEMVMGVKKFKIDFFLFLSIFRQKNLHFVFCFPVEQRF